MIKLIIMTTALIRPILHNHSIKIFYDTYYYPNKSIIDKDFEIYHIINIDSPDKLKQYFTLDETIDNFNKIIPENVNKVYITPEKPAFLDAFKNIMRKINELNLISDKNIYWWFEDDWKATKEFETFLFFDIVKQYTIFSNCAITMTHNCQLGSFRGGPIMNGYFFRKYFDLENLGLMNNTCDPERQVVSYLTSKKPIITNVKRNTGHIRDISLEEDRKIYLNLVYLNNNTKISADFGLSYYKLKYNEHIKFICHIVINLDDSNVLVLNYEESVNNCDIKNFTKMSKMEFYKQFDNIQSIVYTIIKPFNFEDIGRDFSEKYNLIKSWKKIGDVTTY